MSWVKKFGFEGDPYEIIDPPLIPFERIRWDRDDIKDKWQLDEFVEKIAQGYRLGLKIYGPLRCGKTWMLRFLEKSLLIKDKNILVLYTAISRAEPKISVFYIKFLHSLLPHLPTIFKSIGKRAGPTIEDWKKFIPDEDLATCLWNIYHAPRSDAAFLFRTWLLGERLALTDRKKLKVLTTLDGDFKKIETIKNFLNLAKLAFPSVVLCIDEMENATTPLAKALGDSLRDIFDGFYEKFGLVCSYTAEKSDEFVDLGYGLFLYARLEREVRIPSLESDYAPEFLRVHHECYRKKGFKVADQLHPFTESGIKELIKSLDAKYRYPPFILSCLGTLAAKAGEEDVEKIDKRFVGKHKDRFPREYLVKTKA